MKLKKIKVYKKPKTKNQKLKKKRIKQIEGNSKKLKE